MLKRLGFVPIFYYIQCANLEVMKIGFLNISDTRKEVRHMIKRLEKDKQYEIIEVSDIKSNQKNPKYCHARIQYRRIGKKQ